MVRSLAAFVSFALIVHGALCGQGAVRAEVRTATPFGNLALEGGLMDFASWPAGTLVPSGQSSIGANQGNAFADTIVGWQIFTGDIVTLDVSDQGGGQGPSASGTTPSPAAAGAQQGPHALRLLIRGPAGLRGKIEVWGTGIAFQGSSATLAADVLDDGSVDFRLPIGEKGAFDRSQWNLTLDPNGELAVRVITDAAAVPATGSTVYKTGISVRFTPGSFCDIGGYGASCGPRLVGYDAVQGQVRDLKFQLSDGPANAPGLVVIGTQRFSLPIPGTGCLLLTDPVITVSFTTDSIGYAQHLVQVPAGLVLAANLQDVVLVGGSLTTTNAVSVSCR